MSKTWLIARREYLYNLRRPSYLFRRLRRTPLIVVAMWIFIFAVDARCRWSMQAPRLTHLAMSIRLVVLAIRR